MKKILTYKRYLTKFAFCKALLIIMLVQNQKIFSQSSVFYIEDNTSITGLENISIDNEVTKKIIVSKIINKEKSTSININNNVKSNEEVINNKISKIVKTKVLNQNTLENDQVLSQSLIYEKTNSNGVCVSSNSSKFIKSSVLKSSKKNNYTKVKKDTKYERVLLSKLQNIQLFCRPPPRA